MNYLVLIWKIFLLPPDTCFFLISNRCFLCRAGFKIVVSLDNLDLLILQIVSGIGLHIFFRFTPHLEYLEIIFLRIYHSWPLLMQYPAIVLLNKTKGKNKILIT